MLYLFPKSDEDCSCERKHMFKFTYPLPLPHNNFFPEVGHDTEKDKSSS